MHARCSYNEQKQALVAALPRWSDGVGSAGDGFVTNHTLISSYGISDPNPYFSSMLVQPYVNNVIIRYVMYFGAVLVTVCHLMSAFQAQLLLLQDCGIIHFDCRSLARCKIHTHAVNGS